MVLMVIEIFYQKEKAGSVMTSEMLFIYEMLLFATVKLFREYYLNVIL